MTVVVVMIMMMIMMISGQTNLTKGRITAAHGWFNRIHQAGPPETTPKRHLHWFSRFCRAHYRDRPTDHATRSATNRPHLSAYYCDAVACWSWSTKLTHTSSPVLPGWVTVPGFDSRRHHFISVCNQPPRSTQPSILRGTVKWAPSKGRWCSATAA